MRFAQATPYEKKFGVNVFYWGTSAYIGNIVGLSEKPTTHYRATLKLLGDKLVLQAKAIGRKTDIPVDFDGRFLYRNTSEEFMWKGLMWKFADVEEQPDE